MDGAPKGTAVLLEQGWFCAIFPGEAHMVGGKILSKAGNVTKWVVKVASPDEFAV